MSLRLYTSKEDSENFSKSFSTKLYPKFERSTFLFVDFSINKSYKDIFKIQVFYSENGFFYTKFISKEIIRHAFGKWNQLNFMLARDKNKPLTPLFIFDFPLDNSKSPYDALFANINGDLHILSKIYDLSDEHFKLLKKSYKLYKVKGRDYVLFDFGNCFSFIDKFLKNLETILDDIDFKLNDSNELIVNPIPLDSIRKREDDFKYCMICGRKLESTLNKNLLEISRKFPARCVKCLEKIYALELYYKLNEGPISTNMLSTSELKYMWAEEGLFEYNFKLLNDFEFLKPFSDDIYKLYLNDDINEVFNTLLNPIEEKEEESKSKSALDDYFGFNDKKEKPKCKICGEEIDEEGGTDICSNCFEKQMTVEKIHKLIEYVKPGTGFSKSSLIENGFNHIDLDIIIADLEANDLLRYDSDDLIILANRNRLNEFIRQYSDSDEYIIKIKEDELPKLDIFDEDLKSEDSLDKVINLIDYQNFVECNYNNEYSSWMVILKKEGQIFLSQNFATPYQAKLIAVRYLGEIGIINIIKDTKSQKFEDDYQPKQIKKEKINRIEREKKYRKTCPLCGKKFISYDEEGDIFCYSCVKKYNFIEKQALEDIVNGVYDKEFLNQILTLKNRGVDDYRIAKSLNLKYKFSVESLIRFLSDDELLRQIYENLESSQQKDLFKSKNIDSEFSIKTAEKLPTFKICPICGKEFEVKSGSDKECCDECKLKYTPYEIKVLIGIIEGRYDKATAVKIRGLLNQGYPKLEVSQKLNLDTPSLIDPILKFLLPKNYEFKERSSKSTNADKKCLLCGKPIPHKKYSSNRKFCDECKSKYKPIELSALVGIKEGKYTKRTAISIEKLKKEGKNNRQIANILDISYTVVPHIPKFLLYEDVFTHDSDKESDEHMVVCPICKNTFKENKRGGGQKYCNDCKSKYTPIERTVLLDIDKGIYTKEFALEILESKVEGKTNKEIANLFKLPNPAVIGPIIKFLLDEKEINNYSKGNEKKESCIEDKICPICYKKFTPKSSNGSDIYCPICKKKFSPTEIQVLMGIREGKYNTELAYKLKELKELGITNTVISSQEKIPLALVNPIIRILLEDDVKIEGVSYNPRLSNWFVYGKNEDKYINLGFYQTKEEAILAKDKYYKYLNQGEDPEKIIYTEEVKIDAPNIEEENNIKKELFRTDKEDTFNIVLKGTIPESDRASIFNFIPFFNVDLNKLACDKIENTCYELLLDFDADKSDLEKILKYLKELGWE